MLCTYNIPPAPSSFGIGTEMVLTYPIQRPGQLEPPAPLKNSAPSLVDTTLKEPPVGSSRANYIYIYIHALLSSMSHFDIQS